MKVSSKEEVMRQAIIVQEKMWVQAGLQETVDGLKGEVLELEERQKTIRAVINEIEERWGIAVKTLIASKDKLFSLIYEMDEAG